MLLTLVLAMHIRMVLLVIIHSVHTLVTFEKEASLGQMVGYDC